MEIVYYHDDDLNMCPVKKYLEKFLISEFDKPKIEKQKNHILATIDQKIQFIRENPGRQASFLSTLHNHHFIEIKNKKDRNTLIRILYFIHDNMIILLNAFEKPSKYDTDRIKKEIEKYYQITDVYVDKFKKSNNSYENYN